jgi:hypothetical protein
MLKGTHDIFVVVVNFIHNDWEVKHIIILFEVTDTSGIAMVPKLQKLLDWFALIGKIVTYVNDEGSNLQTCASARNFIISCNYQYHLGFVGAISWFMSSACTFKGVLVCHYR